MNADRMRGQVIRAAGGTGAMLTLAAALFATFPLNAAETAEDLKRGAKVFQACAACHSVEPDRHLTGPTLARLFGRKAGTHKGFLRYSEAMQQSGIVWNEDTLDRWLANPAKLIPGTTMVFRGIPDAGARRDLVAFLKAVSDGKITPPGAVSGPRMPRLKSAQSEDIVKAFAIAATPTSSQRKRARRTRSGNSIYA